MTNVSQNVIEFYSILHERYGTDVRALNWGSRESQEKRFKILSELAPLDNQRVLDVGCGIGDFYGWCRHRGISINYTGIDITPSMIAAALERYPETSFSIGTVSELVPEQQFDYVVASGIFYLEKIEPFTRLSDTIREMFLRATSGIAFNSLSSWSKTQTPGEYYANPLQVVEYCKTLSPRVSLRHEYLPHDFTVYVYKDTQSQ